MYGLVLAGGGAKGAYHLGVWKALKELKIPIGAICGTSIGSINGALLAQGDYQKLLKLWKTITINDIVETGEVEGDNLFSLKNLVSYVGSYNSENAVNMKPLEEILNKLVNREKLMKSKIDFGLMTCEMGSMQAVEKFKSEIPADKIVEYLMASARLPGMPVRVIDNKSYLDGAFADNKPVGMLIKQGYRDIISVDVGGMGIIRTALPKGDNIIEINCSENLIGMMEFNRESIDKTIEMGYFDSLRVFGKVSGRKYYLERHDYAKKRIKYSEELLGGIEAAAEIFEVDRYRLYTVEELVNATLDAYRMQDIEFDSKKLEWSEIIRLDKKKMLVILINSYLDNKLEIPDSKMLKEIFKEIHMSLNAILYFSGMKKSPTLPIA